MKAYRFKDSKLYCRTQAEAKSHLDGGEWEQVEIPTDAKGLVDYLNEITNYWAGRLHESSIDRAVNFVPIEEKVDHRPSPQPQDAIEILSGMEDGKSKVTTTVEAIGKSGMYALARYASAVAIRFQQLGVSK